jgi:hypothetical protein
MMAIAKAVRPVCKTAGAAWFDQHVQHRLGAITLANMPSGKPESANRGWTCRVKLLHTADAR